MPAKVIVGMSGGVDSSVAASLLLEDGYEVVGAFMKNWSETKDPATGECAWKKEREDAMKVAAHLGIPFTTFDFEKEYDEAVVSYLYKEYAAGRTPNPDVLCNREIKFELFLREALKLGADFIATGHYARVEFVHYPLSNDSSNGPMVKSMDNGQSENGRYRLFAGLDRNKDQSYFVFSLGQEQLKRVLFPIGHLDKRDVRAYARDRGLPTAEKKDSQGICFIGKVEMKAFLAKAIPAVPGPIVTVEGATIGRHEGLAPFTVGQRHGLGIGGGTPYFVVRKDLPTNTLIVAKGEEHPALFSPSLTAGQWHWVSGAEPGLPLRCEARIRYRQPLQRCDVEPPLEKRGEGDLLVRFDLPQRAVTPGQFVVLYDGDEVLGGGVIEG